MLALIIDDSRAMRRILRQIVEPLGFQIAEAGNGVEGLRRLAEHRETELVLVDWNMPEMNGIDFVKVVRSDPRNRQIKVVMVTTETEPSKMARALMMGVDEFIMKPFTPDVVFDKLQLIGATRPSTI